MEGSLSESARARSVLGNQGVKDPARPERIKTAEAAPILGLSVRTVQAMAARAELPGAARIGQQWTFNEAKLREFIADKERETERKAANIRQALGHRPTARPPPEYAIQQRYEEAMARLLGKTAANAGACAGRREGRRAFGGVEFTNGDHPGVVCCPHLLYDHIQLHSGS
jgi:excisionase family DNA binding protein